MLDVVGVFCMDEVFKDIQSYYSIKTETREIEDTVPNNCTWSACGQDGWWFPYNTSCELSLVAVIVLIPSQNFFK